MGNPWFVSQGIQNICWTFQNEPAKTAELIRRCIDPARIAEFGHIEMPRIADCSAMILEHDPELLLEVYEATFLSGAKPNDEQQLSGGQILAISFRKSDMFQSAATELTSFFPTFLEKEPILATQALIAALEGQYAERRSSSTDVDYEFDWHGQKSRFRRDGSEGRDRGHHTVSNRASMKQTFEDYLKQVASDLARGQELEQIVAVIYEENRLAVLWRALLRVATEQPVALGEALLPLACAAPVLWCYDTLNPMREFLKKTFGNYSETKRTQIERAILSIADAPEFRDKGGTSSRNSLLRCLDPQYIVTTEAKNIIAGFPQPNAAQTGVAQEVIEEEFEPFFEDHFMSGTPIPGRAASVNAFYAASQELTDFNIKYTNNGLTPDGCAAILPKLDNLEAALKAASSEANHTDRETAMPQTLGWACERLLDCADLPADSEAAAYARDKLLKLSNSADPAADQENDANWGRGDATSGHTARCRAAQGLVRYAARGVSHDSEVALTIRKLSKDPVPNVRHDVVEELSLIHRVLPDLMWEITEEVVRNDPNSGVLQGAIFGVLSPTSGSSLARVLPLTKVAIDRRAVINVMSRKRCAEIFRRAYLGKNNAECRDLLFGMIAEPEKYYEELQEILFENRTALIHGEIEPEDPTATEVRVRTFDLNLRIFNAASRRLETLLEPFKPAGAPKPTEEQKAVFDGVAQLLKTLGAEIYFASGAQDEGREERQQTPRRESLDPRKRERFYYESKELLTALASFSHPSITHYLVQMLEHCVEFDPRGVFVTLGSVIRSGSKGGYEQEDMAVKVVVRIVQRYLAEYRSLFHDDQPLREELVGLLDTFVRAWWPDAEKLTHQLAEIFR